MRINPAAVADAVQKTVWQLVEPGLPNPCPGPIRIASEEFLSAAARTIHAIHDAEQGRAASRRCPFECDGTPNCGLAGREPVMPNGLNFPRRWRVKKNDLLSAHDVGLRGTGR